MSGTEVSAHAAARTRSQPMCGLQRLPAARGVVLRTRSVPLQHSAGPKGSCRGPSHRRSLGTEGWCLHATDTVNGHVQSRCVRDVGRFCTSIRCARHILLLLPSTWLRVTGCFGYTGCRDPTSASRTGDDNSSGVGGSSDQSVTVNIAEQGGKIDPLGKVVKAPTGQDITLVVTSDADDEIHVHSDPEHEFEVAAGDQDKKFTFSGDTPGTIEVESHGLDVTILKLQVSQHTPPVRSRQHPDLPIPLGQMKSA